MAGIPLLLISDKDTNDLESGIRKDTTCIEDDFCYRNNVAQANIKIRQGFLKKVYSLLFIQLVITTSIGFVVMLWPGARLYVHNNDWLVSLSFIVSIIILTALFIKRHHTPVNIVLLGIFTLVEAYSVAVIVTFFEVFVVLQALLITVAIVGGLTLFTLQTKRDFSSLGIFLYIGLCVLLIGGFLHLFFGTAGTDLFLSISGAILFSLFIVYDTQSLMNRLSPEEYILATINLYLDIINLFLHILRAIQGARRHS